MQALSQLRNVLKFHAVPTTQAQNTSESIHEFNGNRKYRKENALITATS